MTATQPDLVITRFYTPHGTFGQMKMPDGETLYTIEDPANRNRRGRSCIPEGTYPCRPRRFNKGGYDAVLIENVPGRRLILFHIANTSHDVRGCVGVGRGLGYYRGRWAVVDSRAGFAQFMRHYGNRRFTVQLRSFSPALIGPGSDEFDTVLAQLQVQPRAGEPVILPSETRPRFA